MRRIWTASVAIPKYGIITTVHASESEAWDLLRAEFGLTPETPYSDAPIYWLVDSHDVQRPSKVRRKKERIH